ncbi:MAG: FkbM family methyltransferase [Actinomycetota bacterium]
MHLSLYSVKKLALAPRTALMRRMEKDMDDAGRQMFELHYYRKPLYDFSDATVRNRDILVDVDISAESIVLDVGAFRGEWAEKIWKRYAPTIHAFEPAPGAFRRMAQKFDGNDKVHTYEFGLGGSETAASLALNGPGSSIYDEPVEFGAVEVRIRDVAAVLEEIGLDEIDLLKVNIEGGEYDLLDRLHETGWLPHIRLLLIQFHEWHPKAYRRRRRNRRALRASHEEVWGYPWVWELWRREGG